MDKMDSSAMDAGGANRAAARSPPEITVAVCSYGRPALLGDLVPRLLHGQTGVSEADYRVCVVENSDDPGPFDSLVADFGHHDGLTILRSTPPGISRARNLALKACETPVIAYLDDDAVPDPDWLAGLLEAFRTQAPAIVAGPIRPAWPGPPPDWLPEKYVSCLAILDLGAEDRCMAEDEYAFGANMAFDAETLRAAGGFDLDIGQRGGGNLLRDEDIEVQARLRRAGHRAWYTARAGVTHKIHKERLTRNWFRSRMTWQAVSRLLWDESVRHTERSEREVRLAAHRLGVGDLVARLFEPGDAFSFSAQLDLLHHLFTLVLDAKDRADAPVESAFPGSGGSRAVGGRRGDGAATATARPAAFDLTAPVHPSTRHLFVEGQPGHLFLANLYASLPRSQLLSFPLPVWHAFNPALACLERSLTSSVETVTFVSLDPLIYGPSRQRFADLMAASDAAFSGLLHRLPENSVQAHALESAAAGLRRILVLAEPLVDALADTYGITNVSYLPIHAPLARFAGRDRAETRRRICATDGQVVFSILGQLRPGKGFDLLLEGLRRVPDRDLKGMLFLVAGRSETLSAEEVARLLGEAGAPYHLDLRTTDELFGYEVLSDREFGQYIAASDVGLLLYDQSQRSCMSGVAPNYVSADKPLIASRDSIIGRVIEAHDLGFLVDAQSPERVARCLVDAVGPSRQWKPGPAARRFRDAIGDEAVLATLASILEA